MEQTTAEQSTVEQTTSEQSTAEESTTEAGRFALEKRTLRRSRALNEGRWVSQTQDKYTADENILSDGALTDPICPARSLLLDNDNFHQASLLTYLLQSFVIIKLNPYLNIIYIS